MEGKEDCGLDIASWYGYTLLDVLADDSAKRYWSTSLPTVSHVVFCSVKSGCNSRNAHTRIECMSPITTVTSLNIVTDNGNSNMADHKSIAQRSNQHIEFQQINTSLHPNPDPILPSSRLSILFSSCRSQRSSPSPQATLPSHKNNTHPSGTLGRCSNSRSIKCVSNARRGNQTWYRHLPSP